MESYSKETYRENAQGHLIPIDKIDPVDMARDELVLEIAKRAKTTMSLLKKEKKRILEDVAAFSALSAEKYGVKYRGTKGNLTLVSFDGRYKVVRSMQETVTFDERLQAARDLITQCLRDWTEGGPADLRTLVDDAFALDRQGNLSVGRILSLRRLKITDPRWREAMEAISDSIQVLNSKAYIRVYERDDSGKYVPIPMDIAAV